MPGTVMLASPRGFCAGVERAVLALESELTKGDGRVFARRHIIHNATVVRDLERRGVVFVEEVEDVPAGEVVVLSAHGVTPHVHARARARQLRVVDTTCPLVTKVHREARRMVADGREVVLLGHFGHEEIEGVVGEAPPGWIHVVWTPDEINSLQLRDPAMVGLLTQTTLSVDDARQRVELVRARFPQVVEPPRTDVCFATSNRQAAVRVMAPRADLVLVLGSSSSSNAARLVEVALEAGTPAAYLVESAEVVDPAWLPDHGVVGVTSAASTPEHLVQGLLGWLADQGWGDVQDVTVARETQDFAPPRQSAR